MKKTVSFIMVIMLCLMCCACGNDKTQPEKVYEKESAESQVETVAESFDDQELGYKIVDANPFSDQLAWIMAENTKTNQSQWVCINTSGDIEFVLEPNIVAEDPSPFENGVSFYKNSDGYYTIIDKNGDTVCESRDFFDEIVSYGYGYFAVYKYEESFDAAGYDSFILNSKGDVVFRFDGLLSSPPAIVALGEGMFAYTTHVWSGSANYVFINATNNTTFEVDHVVIVNKFLNYDYLKFCDGVAFAEIGSGSMGDKPALVYPDGTIKELDITEYYFYKYGKISDGGFVYTSYDYVDGEDKVVDVNYYDISTGKVTRIGNYGERVDYDRIEELHFDNGYMMLPLIGADGKNYYTFMNKNGKNLFEPKECINIKSIGYDRYLVENSSGSVVMNGKGETIFENNVHESLSYNNGLSIAIHTDNYITIDGDFLFEDEVLIDK